ncbi:MAG: hypothetical protein CVU99_01660 [Firmicutes bacterium HGW-Firmicutes-4]|jgi:hypothetical protein|nr:MAG: hypothetical protein CVU99_01660 [Firmicutes bacterium HGW-Firmicutes-4]
MKDSNIFKRRLSLGLGAMLIMLIFPFQASAANNWVAPFDAYDSDINYLDVAMDNDQPTEILLRPYYFTDVPGSVYQVNDDIGDVILKAGESADIAFTVDYDGGRIESTITLTYHDKSVAQSSLVEMFTFTHDTNRYYYDSISQDFDGEGVYHDSGSSVALYRPQDGIPCLMVNVGGFSSLYLEIVGVRGLAGGDPGNGAASDDDGSGREGFPVAVVIAVVAGAVVVIGLVIGIKAGMKKPKPAPLPTPKDVVISDPATGAQTRYVQDPVSGEWVDPERGGVLNPERLPEALKQRQEARKWVDQQNQKLQTGDNPFDKELAAEQARQHAKDRQIDELLRVSQRAGALPQSELTINIRKNAQKLVGKLIDGSQPVSPEAIERVRGAFIKTATGRIISAADLPPVPSKSMLFAEAFNNELEEVSRNQTVSAVFFRTVFGLATVGGSELFFQSHKGYLRMRDYVEDGGNSAWGGFFTASWGAVKDYAVSKTADKIIGKVSPSFKNLGNSKSGKIGYDQVKRLVKADINTTDKVTLDIDGKVRRAIKRKFN